MLIQTWDVHSVIKGHIFPLRISNDMTPYRSLFLDIQMNSLKTSIFRSIISMGISISQRMGKLQYESCT